VEDETLDAKLKEIFGF